MEIDSWAHIDIAGVMDTKGETPFLGKGMTGKYKFLACLFYGGERKYIFLVM